MSRKLMQRRASPIDIDCTLERETEKKHEHHQMPCEGTITMPESLAIDKRLV